MPVANVRNDEQAVLLSSEFIRKQDHIYIAAMLPGLFNSMAGIREAWVLNKAAQSTGGLPMSNGVVRATQLFYTLTAGAPAGLAAAAVDDVLSRHGWMAKTRLGETNGFAMYAGSEPTLVNTGVTNYVLPADRGAVMFVGFYLPPTAVAPPLNTSKQLFTKWNQDAVNQRAWAIGWSDMAGVTRIRVYLSGNGIATQTFTSSFNLTPGNSYLVGFSFIPGTSVGIFVNDQYETLLLDDTAGAPPAALFTSNANICLARRDTTAAGTSEPGPDAHYIFAGITSIEMDAAVQFGFYKTVLPIMLWNTDLGGT